MGVLSDRLDNLRLRVELPGGGIVAELVGRSEVRLSFAPGRYARYGERELEAHLASVGRLLWAERMRAYYAAVSDAFDERVTGEPKPVSPRDRDFQAGRDALLAEGRSGDGRIYVGVRGMRFWVVHIAAGTVRLLTEPEFAERAAEAARELITDQQARVRALKDRCYGS
nr:hypothetical protein [Micromonospora sp. DSM 115978]